METVATCSTTDSNGSYHELAPSFFEEMTRCWRQKHCRQRQDNPNGPSKFRKNIACTFRFYVCLRLCDRDCCSAADGSCSCHAPVPSYFDEMTHCRRQKLHWRWPGNPNGRSKFCNLGLFTFTRSQLMLWRRLRGWWRLPDNAQTTRNRRQKHRRDDQDWSKFHKCENLCLRDQAKLFEKLLFAATNDAAIDGITHCFFPASTGSILFSHSKNNFSTTLTLTEKPTYTYCRVFVVDSIYSKTIDIIRQNFFSYFKQRAYV